MTKMAFLIILCFYCTDSYCQLDFNYQYKLIKDNIQRPYETYLKHTTESDNQKVLAQDSLLIDRIIRKYSTGDSLRKFISNRFFLKKFVGNLLLLNRARLEFIAEKRILIEIEKVEINLTSLGEIQYDPSKYNVKTPDNNCIHIIAVNSRNVYGLNCDTSKVSMIRSIKITINEKKYNVRDSLFNDLFFPNLCETAYRIRPVEAFLSPDGNYIYLYLTGGQSGSQFFCKIIFDMRSGNAVGRMIADMHDLSWYQTGNDSFIGF